MHRKLIEAHLRSIEEAKVQHHEDSAEFAAVLDTAIAGCRDSFESILHLALGASATVPREATAEMIDQLRTTYRQWQLVGYPEGAGTLFKEAADMLAALDAAPQSEPALVAQIGKLLGDDPICGGRVSGDTVDAIAALVAPRSEGAGDEDAVREALGSYSLKEGTLAQSLEGFVGNLNYYGELENLGESVRREFKVAANVIAALSHPDPVGQREEVVGALVRRLLAVVGEHRDDWSSEVVSAFQGIADGLRSLPSDADIRAATIEECAIAARDAMCDMEWPPTDGDRQIDAVLAAIRALAASTSDVE